MLVFELGKCECIVATDSRWLFFAYGNKGFRQPLVLMLARDLPQPVVQLLAAAVEPLPVMVPSLKH